MHEHIGEGKDERQIVVDLVFKPGVLQGPPRPEEIRLILSCIGEILAEIEVEVEEKRLAAEPESGNPPCR